MLQRCHWLLSVAISLISISFYQFMLNSKPTGFHAGISLFVVVVDYRKKLYEIAVRQTKKSDRN